MENITESNTLVIDIRNYDEILSKKLNPSIFKNVLYIPSNIMQHNLEMIKTESSKYKNTYIICQSGNRSKKVVDKYFSNTKNIKISPIHINKITNNYLVVSDSITLSLTRKIQIIAGTMILIIGLVTLYFKNYKILFANIFMGIFMLYVGISGNCFLSSILTKNDI